ncbi:putative 4-hydroxybenzoate polyprenyltransferase [bacterium]|nr:putative 4-hydroxybenzoate polyprenyltransferase [bacterium]MBU1752981.1 putative 4-hydroxybenzoate polyprenyltransferase [bacterium]
MDFFHFVPKLLPNRLMTLVELVKFEHTIFALPFAYLGAILACEGIPSLYYWVWITLAMIGARTAGMALNRLIDRCIDAKNPRTQNRALPRGLIPLGQVWLLILGSFILLLFSAYKLNPLCLILSPLAVALLVCYSWMKRFTWLSHLGLGAVLACAPIGGWLAIHGRFDIIPMILGLGVLLWAAGFDLIYATQDVDFDRQNRLYSIPQSFGIKNALLISRSFHILTVVALIVIGNMASLGLYYLFGVAITTILLIYEHRLVSPTDLSRVNQAFFTINGWISVGLLGFTIVDVILW